jgi:hypothetical protein
MFYIREVISTFSSSPRVSAKLLTSDTFTRFTDKRIFDVGFILSFT